MSQKSNSSHHLAILRDVVAVMSLVVTETTTNNRGHPDEDSDLHSLQVSGVDMSELDISEQLSEIPRFIDPYAERQWAKEHMAAAFRVFSKLGFNDGAGGHISLRDPVKPDCFWISRLASAWRRITIADDLFPTRSLWSALRHDQCQ